MLRSINPATEALEGEYDELDASAVQRRLTDARRAFSDWSRRPLAERAAVLRRVAGQLRASVGPITETVVREMGKPRAQARAEADKCAWALDEYAEHAEAMLAPEPVSTSATESLVRSDPLGPILAIMPWNFPLWQVFRCAAPALVAGNVLLLKHAPNVMGCALAIEGLFRDAGAPDALLSVLPIGIEATERVIASPEVRAVTLTGSVRAGARVASLAGAHIKKTVLELGGSDAFIVLGDADLEQTVEKAVVSRTLNTGQSCIAAKRFLVEAPLAERFTEAFVKRMRALSFGDPLDRDVDLGPLARADLRQNLDQQVRGSLAAGARLLCGGVAPTGPGFFYPATVLDGVSPDMPVFEEETFGPVAAVTVVRDVDEAVALANRSRYGLGASLWTQDLDRARSLVGRIDAGSVFVNELVKSDPRLPFGGVKDSGYGRELGAAGIREFVNQKSVWIA